VLSEIEYKEIELEVNLLPVVGKTGYTEKKQLER